MSEQYKTEAIVLKKNKLLEKDILVTLFTEENGKVISIAKGMKNMSSRRAPHIQTGNLVEVALQKHHEMLYLHQSKLISAFSQIKKDEKKVQMLYNYFFLIDRLLPEQQAESRIYILTKRFLIELSKSETFTIDDFTRYMQLLLEQLGYLSDQKSFAELIRFTEEIIHEKIPFSII